jgi:hypothetical protein
LKGGLCSNEALSLTGGIPDELEACHCWRCAGRDPGYSTAHSGRRFVRQPQRAIERCRDAGRRNIFTDGRTLPANDPTPWWFGYSVGKYEGDTLVIETIGLRDEGWLDVQGAPFTSGARITEKFRRPSYGRMEIDVTIDDPKAYTKPWTVRVNWRLGADERSDRVHLSGEQ